MTGSPDRPRRGRVRSGRRAGLSVAVTGAGAGLGEALVRRLLTRDDVAKVVGIAPRRGQVDGVVYRVVDTCDPRLAGRLSGVDVVVHLDLDHTLEQGLPSAGADGPGADGRAEADRSGPSDATRTSGTSRTVRSTQTVLTAAAAAGVRRVVLVTSAMVFGALEDNPVPLPEDAPLRAVADGTLLGELLEVERLAELAPRTHPGLSVTVLRPAALVGDGVDSIVTRHFEAPRLLVVRGSHPRWQFCHVEDLLSALELAAVGTVEGAVTVASDGWLEQEEVERISGLRRIELPPSLAFGTAERLHRLGVLPAPASDLAYLMHPWVVPSTRLREAGWSAQHDNASVLALLLEQVQGHHAVAARRLGRRDATLGAAGAAVAVVGTAALVRRARRARRR
ncbi:MAG: NAD-dependent epimerase/dehydratase family protein [Motilibacteraceae bacterium]